MIKTVAARYGLARTSNDPTHTSLDMTSGSFDWALSSHALSLIHLKGRRPADGEPFDMHGVLFRPSDRPRSKRAEDDGRRELRAPAD